MKNVIFYASRPSILHGSKEDVTFMSSINVLKKGDIEILAEGFDFKYIQSNNLKNKIEKLVCKIDRMFVLHDEGIIDQKQYYEVTIALKYKIPILAMGIRGRNIKKVIGIEKYFNSGIRKRAVLKLIEVLPN